MDKQTAEAIALFRHQIISPVLMEKGRSQMAYFNSLEHRDFDVPGRGLRRIRPSTMKGWLVAYKKHGFMGIKPKVRLDKGGSRRLQPEVLTEIIDLRKKNEDMSATRFYELCLKERAIGMPPICLATLRRVLKQSGLSKRRAATPRKRFEMSRFGEMWVGDFCHTRHVYDGKRKRKAILFAIIDDHSRMIVGSRFSLCETTIAVEKVFKEAITAHGLPDKFYCDNGSSFSSAYLARACAQIGIGLIHSKPYDSASRGKIERFFRTVRQSFLADIRPDEVITLDQINERFEKWLRDDYHHHNHRGIDTRPIDRYLASVSKYPQRRIDLDLLNEHFFVSCDRKVNKDATISYRSIIYEVPAQYIGQQVEIRHVQDDYDEVYIYRDDERQCQIKPVDSRENARIYRGPSPETHVSFQRPKDAE